MFLDGNKYSSNKCHLIVLLVIASLFLIWKELLFGFVVVVFIIVIISIIIFSSNNIYLLQNLKCLHIGYVKTFSLLAKFIHPYFFQQAVNTYSVPEISIKSCENSVWEDFQPAFQQQFFFFGGGVGVRKSWCQFTSRGISASKNRVRNILWKDSSWKERKNKETV